MGIFPATGPITVTIRVKSEGIKYAFIGGTGREVFNGIFFQKNPHCYLWIIWKVLCLIGVWELPIMVLSMEGEA
jgi:hypothetical protein